MYSLVIVYCDRLTCKSYRFESIINIKFKKVHMFCIHKEKNHNVYMYTMKSHK